MAQNLADRYSRSARRAQRILATRRRVGDHGDVQLDQAIVDFTRHLAVGRRYSAQTVRAYRDLGFDGIMFHPCVAEIDQIDRLADAVL